MSEIVGDCARCGATHTTFDLQSATIVGVTYGWKQWYEAYCVCRHCHTSMIFKLSDKDYECTKYINKNGLSSISGSVSDIVNIEGFVSLKDAEPISPPEDLPKDIESVFNEGARCLAVGCFNAAGTMFRLCVDLATKSLLPGAEDTTATQPNSKQRRDLGLRLPWLFEQNLLPQGLHDLSACIKEDGNDGAHAGTLERNDAEDLLDFTTTLLDRLYSEPARIKKAKERQLARRTQQQK